jgi:hypothetical protein
LSDPQEEAAGFIPRSRLETLTDAVFAFAMTLLVIELPEGFHPKANREFLHALSGLSDTFTAYLITFFVLVGFWSRRAEETGETDMASPDLARATVLPSPGRHLLAVLDAGGEPMRFGSGCLDLRRQYDSLVRDGICHRARRWTGQRPRG